MSQSFVRPRPLARLSGGRHAETAAACAMAAPAAVLLLVLLLGPTIAVLLISLSDWDFGASQAAFAGLSNFESVLADPVFRASFGNTLQYIAVVVPATLVLGLAVALLIESGGGFRRIYRTIHFLPVMATLASMALAWEAMLHPTIGLVSQILAGLGFESRNWLRDPELVMPTLCVVGIWQHTGFAMVLFLAGLRTIPQDLYNAAEIDGASDILGRLTTVTLPMLGPTALFVLIVVSLRALEVFDTVRVLTQGGPGSASEVLLHTLYVESFEFLRPGHGAAITVIFLALAITLTLLQMRVLDRRVHYA